MKYERGGVILTRRIFLGECEIVGGHRVWVLPAQGPRYKRVWIEREMNGAEFTHIRFALNNGFAADETCEALLIHDGKVHLAGSLVELAFDFDSTKAISIAVEFTMRDPLKTHRIRIWSEHDISWMP